MDQPSFQDAVLPMQRVLIIGCPGAGKTTFAGNLARLTNLPLFHLDRYYYDLNFDYQTNRETWRRQVMNLVSADRWIIEGNYKSSLDLRIPRADTIIFLDYPLRITGYRALKRRIMLHGQQRPDMPSTWKEHISPGFAKFVWNYNRTQRPIMLELLDQYRGQKSVAIFKHPREARQYLGV